MVPLGILCEIRIHLKPTQLIGGYAQISYHFNYYGPIGNQRDVYVQLVHNN
jgi:nitrate reductase alpha subunit